MKTLLTAALMYAALAAGCTHETRQEAKEVVQAPLHPTRAHEIAQEVCGIKDVTLKSGSLHTIKGRVTAVRDRTMCSDDRKVTEITVDDAGTSRDVYLGTSDYLRAHALRFATGDSVTINAARLAADDKTLVARDISVGGETLSLRSASGRAAWSTSTAH